MPVPKHRQGGYTYADYQTSSDNERWEIIEGVAYQMTPPTIIHQRILRRLSTEIDIYLRGRDCEVFFAPVAVVLSNADEDLEKTSTVVEPDLIVVCDPKKITPKGCVGAPDFVVEITSPTTAKQDHIRKRMIYEQNNVQEYWIIDPINRIVTVYLLFDKGKFSEPKIYSDEDIIPIDILCRHPINMKDIFGPAEL